MASPTMKELAAETGDWSPKWYASFFKDQSALGYYDLHLYSGFFEATAQAIVSLTRKISPLGFYETRHLINARWELLMIPSSDSTI